MRALNIVRYIFLGTLAAIGLATLGLSASLLAILADNPTFFVPVFIPLDLAAGVLTLVAVIPSIIINFFREGAFTSMVAVEIGWTAVLMVIWVAAAGETTAELAFVPKTCNYFRFDSATLQNVPDTYTNSFCRQQQAVEAMAWLGFIGFLAWSTILLIYAIIAHSRGNPAVWKKSVTSTNFTERIAKPKKAQTTDYQDYPSGQPMQQQNTGYSQTQYSPHPAAQPLPQQPMHQQLLHPQPGMGYPPNGQYLAGYNTPSPAPTYNTSGVAQV